MNETLSDSLPVKHGVPQGTVLGPIFFIIYLTEMCKLNFDGNLIVFADDSAIVTSGETWEDTFVKAENALNQVNQWLSENLLFLNFQKTNYLCFSNNIIQSQLHPYGSLEIKIHMNNCSNSHTNCFQIEKKDTSKYLGIFIQENLKWDRQVDKILNQLRLLTYCFRRLKSVFSEKQLLTFYNSLVKSILTYCITSWGNLNNKLYQKVEVLHKKIIKIIYSKPRRYPTVTLYKESGLLSFRELFVQNVMKFIVKNKTLFPRKEYDRTRNINPLHIPRKTFTQTQKHICYVGPKLFNNFTNCIPNFEWKITSPHKQITTDLIKLWKQNDKCKINVICG